MAILKKITVKEPGTKDFIYTHTHIYSIPLN